MTLSHIHQHACDLLSFQFRAARRHLGIPSPTHFCLSTGRCGSKWIVHLLHQNGIRNCYHELSPDLLREGIAYHRQRLETRRLAEKIRTTRRGIFFESNNRLFSLARPIRMAFPDARFVFLYRDGRDVVRSGMQRKWFQHDDHFGRIRLGAEDAGSAFQKVCRYWANVNERILSDLESIGGDYLPIRFEDLVSGPGVNQLGTFLNVSLEQGTSVPAVNGTADWRVPSYEEWPLEWRKQFNDTCGPMMDRLAYVMADGSTCYTTQQSLTSDR